MRVVSAHLILLSLAFSAAVIASSVNFAGGNPFFPRGSQSEEPVPPLISVNLPQPGLAYNTGHEIWLDFTLTVPMTSWFRSDGSPIGTTFGSITSVKCYLDNKLVSATLNRTYMEHLYYSLNLGTLAYGSHTLKIEVEGVARAKTTITNDLYAGSVPSFNESVPTTPISNSTEISFFVNGTQYPDNSTPEASSSPTPANNSTVTPTISILFPLNDSLFNVSLGGVYYRLVYETNSTLSWVGYSLDDADNETVTGNSTFVHQFVSSNGYHTLTVFSNDTLGNWATPQTVTYFVNFYPDYTPTPPPSPTLQSTLEPNQSVIPLPGDNSPAILTILITILIAVVVVIAALAYFKRRG